MLTLGLQLTAFPESIIDLKEDTWIQIVDYSTCAHYRYSENEEILLGGNHTEMVWEDLLKRPVRSIWLSSDGEHLEIHID